MTKDKNNNTEKPQGRDLRRPDTLTFVSQKNTTTW